MALSSQILGLVTQRLLMTMFPCSFEMPDRDPIIIQTNPAKYLLLQRIKTYIHGI